MSVIVNVSGAPLELLEIPQLLAIHSMRHTIDPWVLNTFFPNRASFAAEQVPVASLKTYSVIAPLVAPSVKGRPIDGKGQADVKFIKPAYLKPTGTVTPSNVYDTALLNQLRNAGVIGLGGNMLSAGEALLVAQIEKFTLNRQSIDNRKTLMAIECLLTGKLVLRSDDFPEYIVDYNRDAACTYAPATLWSAGGATVVSDIEAMMKIAVDKGGVSPRMALTTSKVYTAMINNAEFKARFVTPLAGISAPVTPQFNRTDKPQYRGMFDGLEIWAYDAGYIRDVNGSEVFTRYIPETYFGLVSDMDGTLSHCGILHLDAYMQPLEYFDYMDESKNPSAITMLAESSPLVSPSNKNGVVGGTGFVA